MKGFIGFIIGLGVGISGTILVMKEYYKRIADEEIESVKEAYGQALDKVNEKQTEIDTFKEYHKITNNYVNPDIDISESNSDFDEESDTKDEPYVITSDRFGDKSEYECISLTYYDDKILCDENDEPIENQRSTLGDDWKEEFEAGEDIVFVRNDMLKRDYEIARSEFSYIDDVLRHKPKG